MFNLSVFFCFFSVCCLFHQSLFANCVLPVSNYVESGGGVY